MAEEGQESLSCVRPSAVLNQVRADLNWASKISDALWCVVVEGRASLRGHGDVCDPFEPHAPQR